MYILSDPVKTKTIWIPQAIVIAMLLWALNPGNPYGYYQFLRLVCCGVFAFLAVIAIAREHTVWPWLLGLTAVLYNPFIPVHLDRETWGPINLATAALAGASILSTLPNETRHKFQTWRSSLSQNTKDLLRLVSVFVTILALIAIASLFGLM